VGVKGACHAVFYSDGGTLGTSGEITPIYNSGDTWSGAFGQIPVETALALRRLSEALWDRYFPECMGLQDGNAWAEWIVAGNDGQPRIEISYLDGDCNAPDGGGEITLDQDGKKSRRSRKHEGNMDITALDVASSSRGLCASKSCGACCAGCSSKSK
jgi:hypothetical protein